MGPKELTESKMTSLRPCESKTQSQPRFGLQLITNNYNLWKNQSL